MRFVERLPCKSENRSKPEREDCCANRNDDAETLGARW
jgi:hypothetical protein